MRSVQLGVEVRVLLDAMWWERSKKVARRWKTCHVDFQTEGGDHLMKFLEEDGVQDLGLDADVVVNAYDQVASHSTF